MNILLYILIFFMVASVFSTVMACVLASRISRQEEQLYAPRSSSADLHHEDSSSVATPAMS